MAPVLLWTKLTRPGSRDPQDAGLLARQAEIEALEQRCRGLAAALGEAQRHAENLEAQSAERAAALEQARADISARLHAQHDAEIEHLKASQAEERYRERSAQVRAEPVQSLGVEVKSLARQLLADVHRRPQRVLLHVGSRDR